MLEMPILEKDRAPGADSEAAAALPTVCVVGLGYVGLPVAVEFGKRRLTVGYDLSSKKVQALKQFNDPTGELAPDDLSAA